MKISNLFLVLFLIIFTSCNDVKSTIHVEDVNVYNFLDGALVEENETIRLLLNDNNSLQIGNINNGKLTMTLPVDIPDNSIGSIMIPGFNIRPENLKILIFQTEPKLFLLRENFYNTIYIDIFENAAFLIYANNAGQITLEETILIINKGWNIFLVNNNEKYLNIDELYELGFSWFCLNPNSTILQNKAPNWLDK